MLLRVDRRTTKNVRRRTRSSMATMVMEKSCAQNGCGYTDRLLDPTSSVTDLMNSSSAYNDGLSSDTFKCGRRQTSSTVRSSSFVLCGYSLFPAALFSSWPTKLLVCAILFLCSPHSFIYAANAQYFGAQHTPPPPLPSSMPAAGDPTASDQFAALQQQYARSSMQQPSPPTAAALQQQHSAFSGSVGEGTFARQSALPQSISGGGAGVAGRSAFRLNAEKDSSSFQQTQQQTDSAAADGGGRNGAYTDQSAAVGFKCREPFGHHAVHHNCSMFIVCVFSNPVVQECQGTTVYNHKLGTCDWRHNSECPAPGDGFFAIGQDAQGQQITGIGELPPLPTGPFNFGNFAPPPPPPPPPPSAPKPPSGPYLPPLPSLSNFGASNSFVNNFNQPRPQPPPPPSQQFFQQQQQQQSQSPPPTRPPFSIQPLPQSSDFRPPPPDRRQQTSPKFDPSAGRNEIVISQSAGNGPPAPPPNVVRNNNDQQSNVGSERLTHRQNQPPPQPPQQPPPRPPSPGIDPKNRSVLTSSMPWWLEQSPTSQQHQQRPQLDITAKSRVPVNAVGSDSPSPTTAASTTSAAPLAASSSNVDTSKHPWWLEPVQPPVLEAAASTREPSAAVIYRPNSLESSTQLLQQHQNIHRQQLADIEKQLLLREKLIQQHQQKQQQPNAQSSNTNAISPWNSPPQNVPQQLQQQQQQQQKRPQQPPSASTLIESESTNKPTHQQLVGRQQQPPTTNYNFKSSQPTLATRDTSYQMQPHYQQRTIVEHVHAKPEYHDIVIPDQRPFWMAPGEQAAAAAVAASRSGGGGGSGARLQQVDGGNVQLVRILPNDHANWHIVPPSAASGDGPPSTVPPSSVAEPPVSNLGARQQTPRHPPSPQPHPPMRPDRPHQPPPQSQQQHRHPPPPPPPGVIGRTFPLAPSPPPPPQYQIHPPVFSRTARHTPSAVFTPHSSPMSSVKMLNFSRPSYPEYARPSPLPATIHQFQPQMRKFERITALHTPAVRAQQKRTQYEQQFSPQPHPARSSSHSEGFHGRSLIAATPYVLTFKQQQQQEFAGEPTEPISTRTPRATTHRPWWVSADALSPTVPVGVVRPQQPLNRAPTRESVMYWTPMRPTSAEVEHTASKRRTDSQELPTPPPPAVIELPVVINGAHQQQQQQHHVNSHDITNAARHRYHQQQQQQQRTETVRDYLKPWWVDLPSTPMMNPYELHTPMPTTAKPWWIMNWWDAAQHTSPPVLPSYGFTPPYHLPPYLASRPTAAATTAYDGLPLFAAPSLSHWLTVPLQTAISNPNDLFRFSFPTAVVAELPKPQSQQSNNSATANPASNSTQSKNSKGSTQSTVAPMTPHDSRTTTSTTTTTTSPPIYFDTSNMNNEMSATWHFVSDIGVTTTTAPTTLQPAQQFFETTAPWWYAEPPLYGTLAPTFEWSPPQTTSNTNSSSSLSVNASNSKQPRSIGIPSHAALIASQVEYAPPIIKHKKSSRPLMIEMNNLFSAKYAGDNNVIRVANSKLFMEPFGPGFKHQQKPWQHDVQQQSEAASANASNTNTDDMIDTSVVLSSKANVVFSNGGEPARTANFALPSSSSNSAAAVDCDNLKCNIPHCWCGSTATPGNFPLSATPQIVLLTFDDALTEQNYQIYQRILRNRTNPNGCPIRATFYISHEWSEYHLIQNLHSDGHEIASHSVSHSLATRNTSKLEWAREIDGQRRILSQFAQIPLDEIRGMRAPYLQPGGNAQYEMLWEQGFLYDSSLSVSENNPPFWPYTLDFRLPHKCWIPPCPTKPYPGLWQVPMVHWEDLLGYRCAMADACHNPGSVEEVYELLTKNFMRHYKSNRAPFGMFYHSAWFMHHYHMKGFEKFLDELLEQPDVWLVSTADAIAWMQQPTPLSHIDQFEPWQCDTKQNKSRRPRTDRLPAEKCTKPSVCPATFRGGMRYLRTCAECPAEYPWLDNPTGARRQHHASSTATTSSFPTASPTPSYL